MLLDSTYSENDLHRLRFYFKFCFPHCTKSLYAVPRRRWCFVVCSWLISVSLSEREVIHTLCVVLRTTSLLRSFEPRYVWRQITAESHLSIICQRDTLSIIKLSLIQSAATSQRFTSVGSGFKICSYYAKITHCRLSITLASPAMGHWGKCPP